MVTIMVIPNALWRVLALSAAFALLVGQPVEATDTRRGEHVYEAVCSACHMPGNIMVPAPKAWNATDWRSRLAGGRDRLLTNAIKGVNAMPAMGGCDSCSVEDIRGAIEYMLPQN